MDVETGEREFRERLTEILRATPLLMRVLSVARHLCLPDWLVFSGAVYQPVLSHLTGRPLDYGIKDYDLALARIQTGVPGRPKRDLVEPSGHLPEVHLSGGDPDAQAELSSLFGCGARICRAGWREARSAEIEGALQYPPPSVGEDAQAAAG
jgi:hypothetical protein